MSDTLEDTYKQLHHAEKELQRLNELVKASDALAKAAEQEIRESGHGENCFAGMHECDFGFTIKSLAAYKKVRGLK